METTQLPYLTTMMPAIVTTLGDFFFGTTFNYTNTTEPAEATEAPELPHIFASFAWCRNTEDNIVDVRSYTYTHVQFQGPASMPASYHSHHD